VAIGSRADGPPPRCPHCGQPWERSANKHHSSVADTGDHLQTADLEVPREVSAGPSLESRLGPVKGPKPPEGGTPTGGLGQLGRFELRAALGQGGFGMVYRAYDPVLDREVALKVPTFPPDQPDKVARFLGEAKAAARLRHPNIVAVFETGQAGNDYYIASEFVEGMPLSVRIANDPPSFHQAAGWVRDLALALNYAHDEGIIHRDVKPANIMIDKRNRAQLMDFGLARRLGEEAGETSSGTVVGTPAYMAPEQARGDSRAIGPACDQYSLGVVLYELLTGERPYEGSSPVIRKKVADPDALPPRPRDLQPDIPLDLEAVCCKAMAKEPRRRYRTAGDFAVDLQHWLKVEDVQARRIGAVERFVRSCRRHPALALARGLALLAFLLALGIGVWFAIYQSLTSDELRRKQQKTENALAETQTERDRADKERREAQRALGNLYREQGLRQCEQGRPAQGILFLARAIESAAALGEEESRRLAEANLAFFAGRVVPLRGMLPLGGSPFEGACAFTADGKALLTSAAYRAVLRDPCTGKPHGETCFHGQRVCAVAISRDGRMILTGGVDSVARLHDAVTGKPIGKPLGKAIQPPHTRENIKLLSEGKTIPTETMVTSAAIHPSGRLVLTNGGNRAQLWDVGAGEPIDPPLEHKGHVNAVAFNPDGEIILTGCADRTAQRWSTKTHKRLGSALLHEDSVSAVAFSPDGKLLLTGSGKTARLWSSEAGRRIGPIFRHNEEVRSVAFAADNRTFVASSGTAAQLWDAKDGVAPSPPLENQQPVSQVAFSPDGETVLTATSTAVRLWDVMAVRRFSRVFHHDGRIESISVSPDGKVLVTTGLKAQRWDVATGQRIGLPFQDENQRSDYIRSVHFSPDNQTMLTLALSQARLWGTATGRQRGGPLSNGRGVERVVFRPDGKAFLMVHRLEGEVRQWDSATLEPLGKPLKHPWVSSAGYSGDGKVIVTWKDSGGTVQRWDAETGRALGSPLLPAGHLSFAMLAPDGKVLLTVSMNQGQLWDVGTGAAIGAPMRQAATITKAAFSAASQALVTCTAKAAQLWDAKTAQPRGKPISLGEQSEEITQVVLSPDGTRFATLGRTRTQLWNSVMGQAIGGPLRHEGKTLTVQQVRTDPRTGKRTVTDSRQEQVNDIESLAFSADGALVLTTSEQSARVWNAATGQALGLPMRQGGRIVQVRWQPDGTILTTSGNEVRLWAPTPRVSLSSVEAIVSWVQTWTGLELTADGKVRGLDAAAWARKAGK
jgi:WD40 repeat protein